MDKSQETEMIQKLDALIEKRAIALAELKKMLIEQDQLRREGGLIWIEMQKREANSSVRGAIFQTKLST